MLSNLLIQYCLSCTANIIVVQSSHLILSLVYCQHGVVVTVGLETTLDAAHKDEVPVLKKKKTELKKQIDVCYTSMRKFRSNYYDQKKKFHEYMKVS